MAASKTLTPEQRIERARKAGQASALKRSTLDYHINKVVDRAPELTPEQTDRLRAIFGGAVR